MKALISIVFLLSLLDAFTTYYIVASGIGVEANPVIADIINGEPLAVFPLALASASIPAAVLLAVDAAARRMPAAAAVKVRRATYIIFTTAAAFRSAVVINNFLGIVAGMTPLADYLFR